MPDRSPIAIVLAAGGSTRMGRPKALLRYRGDTLLAHHVQGLRDAGFHVRVAVGAHAVEVGRAALAAGAEAVANPDWARSGPTRSLLVCLAGLPDEAHVLVSPVDVPPAPAAVLRALQASPGGAVACIGGEDGHPVRVRVGAVRALRPGQTLRDALVGAARVAIDWPDGLRNLNTPEAFSAWRTVDDAPG